MQRVRAILARSRWLTRAAIGVSRSAFLVQPGDLTLPSNHLTSLEERNLPSASPMALPADASAKSIEMLLAGSIAMNAGSSALSGVRDTPVARSNQIINVNESPSVSLSHVVISLPDDVNTSDSRKVADILLSNDDLETKRLTLAGSDASSFEIVGSELHLQAGAVLNALVRPTLSVVVCVDNSSLEANPDDTAQFTLIVVDANPAPTPELTNIVTRLPEDIDTTGPIRVADISIIDDGIGVNLVELEGDEARYFEVDGGSLYLRAGMLLDHTMTPSLSVRVVTHDLSDGESTRNSENLVIAITNVNDSLRDIGCANFSAVEHQADW